MTAPLTRTSAYLQRCLDRPVGDSIPAPVSGRTSGELSVWDWLGPALLYQYEGLHHVLDSGPISESEKGALAVALDDFLCRTLVRTVPAMVERLLKFERVVTEEQPNQHVQVVFEQAMHSYVLGLPAAAVALARACLEQALRETIRLPHAASLDLAALIAAADRCKALDGGLLQMARQVQIVGNRVLHRKACTDDDALETIVCVRAVVERLYGPAPDE